MKTVLLGITTFLLLTGAAAAQDATASWREVESTASPRFERYRVAGVFRGEPAPVKLSSRRARMFRTVLRESAREGVNFAGHYILATWGCGTGCSSIAIIDALTGRVHFTPSLLMVGTAPYQQLEPYEFRRESRLLKVVGQRNNGGMGTYFYEWKNNRLSLIRAYENKQVR